MFDRMTDRARKVINLAKTEAANFGGEYIGAEHLLLALLNEGSGMANIILNNLNVDIDKLKEQIKEMIPQSSVRLEGKFGSAIKRTFTPLLKRVLEHSFSFAREQYEAGKRSNLYIGTEDLLYGLMKETRTFSSGVLNAHGITLNTIRLELEKLESSKIREDYGKKIKEDYWRIPIGSVSIDKLVELNGFTLKKLEGRTEVYRKEYLLGDLDSDGNILVNYNPNDLNQMHKAIDFRNVLEINKIKYKEAPENLASEIREKSLKLGSLADRLENKA